MGGVLLPGDRVRFVLDVETGGLGRPRGRPTALLAVVYDGAEFREWWAPAATLAAPGRTLGRRVGDLGPLYRALDWCLSSDGDVEVWAHYGGGFDFRLALDRLARAAEGELRWRTVGSGVLALEGRDSRGRRFALRDSIRLLPGSVREIGEAVGLPKLEMDHEHPERIDRRGRLSPAASCPRGRECVACLCRSAAGRARVLAYCRRDCQIVHVALDRARARLSGIGARMRLTLASSVTSAIRDGLPEEERAWTPHGDAKGVPDVDAEVEAAQFGGRVEVFAPVCGVGRFYDIRSSYPASMAAAPLPWIYDRESRRADWRSAGTTECEVLVPPDCYLPVLPVRGREGRLYWPTGRLSGHWVTEELAYAQEVGAAKVLRVRGQHRWSTSDALREWILRAWEERRTTTGFDRYFWKIAMNAIYGKTVEGREKEDFVQHPETCEGMALARSDLDLWSRESYYQPAFRNVATGATITARSRVALHRWLVRAIAGGSTIHYSDTDSLAVSGGRKLPTGDGLGELECKTMAWGLFVAPKLYAWEAGDGETVVRAKGLPGLGVSREERARRDYAPAVARFLRVSCGAPWAFSRGVGIREAIRGGGPVGYRRAHVTRSHDSERPGKRRWLPEGAAHPLLATGSAPWPASLLP